MHAQALLTQKQVAKLTQMSESWLEQQRIKGSGIPYIKIGRAVRYRSVDVESFIEEHIRIKCQD